MAEQITKIRIKYNPYLICTETSVNGEYIEDGSFYDRSNNKAIGAWVQYLPEFLSLYSGGHLSFWFCGLKDDMEKIKSVFEDSNINDMFDSVAVHYEKGIVYKNLVENIAAEFASVRKKLLVDDPQDVGLRNAYREIASPYFRINVIATMSAGKSTLINSLIGKKLMPSRNEACTASVMELLDTDKRNYTAEVFDAAGNIIEEYQSKLDKLDDVDADVLNRLNQDTDVSRIRIKGDIPFVDAKGTALMLVDTPGPNNSQDDSHKNITYTELEKGTRSIVLYVLNATQIGTADDDILLRHVSRQVQKYGKEEENRTLFVLNKMDSFDPDNENIQSVVDNTKKYLNAHGIQNPRIFICSAKVALQLRTDFRNIDISNLTRDEERKLPIDARETLPLIDKLLDCDNMHFEKYATVSSALNREISADMKKAERSGDVKKIALIHSGIYSLEKYISLYIKGRTTRDLMEFLEKTLDNSVM